MKKQFTNKTKRPWQWLWGIPILLMSLASASHAQTIVTVGNPSSTSYTYQLPINNLYNYSYTQQILLSSEIATSGDIAKIRFKYNTGSLANNDNWTVYLGYKSAATFASTTDWVPIGSLTSVFTGTVTASGGWIELILSTPFTYNTALGNLVVAVDENSPSYTYTSNMFPYNSGTNRAIHYRADGTNPDPASPPTASGRLNFFNTIQLDFACATSPVISASSSSPACVGGALNLYCTSSDPSSTFAWTGPGGFASTDQNPVISGVTMAHAGTYTVVVTEPLGCTSTATVSVTVNPSPTIDSVTATDTEFCAGGSTTLTAYVSPPPSTYCNSNFTNVTWEFITNVDYGGMSNTSAGTAGGPVDYTSMTANVTAGVAGNLSVTIDSDVGDYVYAWIDWNQNGSFADAGETYTLATNTSSAGPHILSITPPMTAYNGNTRMRVMVDWNNATPNSCRSASFGEAEDYTVNVTGGADQYTYSWSDGMSVVGTTNSITVSPTDTTTYTVTVTNANGCDAQDSVEIIVNPPAVVTTDPTGATVCEGQPITLTGAGTGTGFQWLKDGAVIAGETNDTLTIAMSTMADAGSYQLIAVGAGGCNDTSAAATVTVNAMASITTDPTGVSVCEGQPISLSGAGTGTGYQWLKDGAVLVGETSATLSIAVSVLADAGNYQLISTNAFGCNDTSAGAAVSVTAYPVIDSISASDKEICNGASVDLAVVMAGGTGAAAYCNSNFTSTSFEHITNVDYAGISNASAGNTGGPVDYTAMTANVTAGVSNDLSVTILADAFEYVYAWIDWNQDNDFADAGETYTLATNTSSAGPHILSITPPMTAYNGNTRMRVMVDWNNPTPNSCRSASFGEAEDYTVNVTGGMTPPTYSWSDGVTVVGTTSNITVTPTATTLYTVTVTNGPGCSSQDTVTITVNSVGVVTTDPTGTTVCEGQPFSLSGAGTGAGYQWLKDGAELVGETASTLSIATATAANAGSYQLIVLGGGGCNDTSAAAVVSVNANPVIDSISASATEICNGDSVNLSVALPSPILTYCNSNFTNATYDFITNVDYGGMSNTSAGTIGGPVDYTSMTANVTAGVAGNLSVTIDPDAFDYVYAWIDWNQNGSFADAGETHTLATSTSSAGPHILSITPPMTVLNGNTRMRVMVDFNNPTPNSCRSATWGEAEDYTVNVTGGADPNTYSWSDGMSVVGTTNSITVSPTDTTTYTVTVTNASGCDAQDSVEIAVKPRPDISATPSDNTDCHTANGSISITSPSFVDGQSYEVFYNSASAGTFTVASGSIDISGLDAGTYTDLYLGSVSGCNSDTIASVVVGGISSASDTLATSTSNEGFNQGAGVTRDYRNASCELIATINSTGGALGNVVTEVVVEPTAGMVNGMPYASRHYEITADNATTPATVTLYLTPDEVTDYNANNDTFPDLDAMLSNIKVTAYHNLPGMGGAGPNGHDLANTELITSVSAYFNAAEDRWELTFVTSGFSGFYFHTTSNNTPLNISMGPLSGKRDGNMNVLSWNSLDESNASHFEVERSQDGRTYTQIGQVKAKGNPSAYTYQDADFLQGNNFYKVAFVDVNGKKVYSNIVKLVVSNNFTISAFPNPTTNDVTLSLEGELGANPRVFVTDLSGRVVYQTTTITGSELIIPMKALAPGVYVIKYTDDIQNAVIKVSKTN